MKKFYFSTKQGFTLFIAIVITATLLLISTGIISVAVKEAFLTSSSRFSQESFYAADSGLECALFWDLRNPTGLSAFSQSNTDGTTISCNGQSYSTNTTGENKFTLTFPPSANCVEVFVKKRPDNAVAPPAKTIIESYGYNSCDVNNPRRVQRAIRVSY